MPHFWLRFCNRAQKRYRPARAVSRADLIAPRPIAAFCARRPGLQELHWPGLRCGRRASRENPPILAGGAILGQSANGLSAACHSHDGIAGGRCHSNGRRFVHSHRVSVRDETRVKPGRAAPRAVAHSSDHRRTPLEVPHPRREPSHPRRRSQAQLPSRQCP
jgi:hypothetical protein